MKRTILKAAAFLLPAAMLNPAIAGTQVKVGGFAKLDTMATWYSKQRAGETSLLNDAVVTWPLSSTGGSKGYSLDFSAKTSRIYVGTKTDMGEAYLKSHWEMDHILSQNDGNRSVSNSYHSRLRRAFGVWGFGNHAILFGQDWSTFMSMYVFGETLDFNPSMGTFFVRQPMVRWTMKNNAHTFTLAAESPETDTFYLGGTTANQTGGVSSTKETLPDIIARYSHAGGYGKLGGAFMVRKLNFENGTDVGNSSYFQRSKTGLAMNVVGKLKLWGRDSFGFQFNYGQLGRYVAIGGLGGATIANADGSEFKTLKQFATSLNYQHVWNDNWRTNVEMGQAHTRKEDLMVTGSRRKYTSFHLNLVWSPVKPFTVGGEYIYGTGRSKNNPKARMSRFQVSFKYNFGGTFTS